VRFEACIAVVIAPSSARFSPFSPPTKRTRSLVVHGSNPTTKELEAQLHKISGIERTTWLGLKWALALDRARDLLRRAILARACLLDGDRWPSGRKAGRFDVDAQLIEANGREEWRESWRTCAGGDGPWFA